MEENKETARTQEVTPKAEDIAASLLAAIESRTQRAERSVAKSFSEQYGLTEGEINEILSKAKTEKESKIPESAQAEINKQLDGVKGLLIAAEVKTKGNEMGLVDADTALLLLDRESIKVDDKGGVTGVSEALTALKEKKPFLFTAMPTGKKADVGGNAAGQGAKELSGVEAAFYKRNPRIKKLMED